MGAFILFEIFAGESAQASGATNVSEAVKQSFNNMRIIVSLGWATYPAGYFLGQVNKSASAAQALNVPYTIAGFVNKIAFVLACWSCAKSDTESVDAKPRGSFLRFVSNARNVQVGKERLMKKWGCL